MQPPPRTPVPIPPSQGCGRLRSPLGGSRQPAAPGTPFIAGEGTFEKPASNWKNAAELNSKKRRRERARNRKAPARLSPSPQLALGGDGTAAKATQGCYQPRAGAAVLLALATLLQLSLVFQQTGCLRLGWQLPRNFGARVPLATPGPLSSVPWDGGLRCTPGRVPWRGQTYLLPAAPRWWAKQEARGMGLERKGWASILFALNYFT